MGMRCTRKARPNQRHVSETVSRTGIRIGHTIRKSWKIQDCSYFDQDGDHGNFQYFERLPIALNQLLALIVTLIVAKAWLALNQTPIPNQKVPGKLVCSLELLFYSLFLIQTASWWRHKLQVV